MKVFKKSKDIFAGSIMGISGVYADAIFRIDPDENITIGRDPKTSHIVVDEGCSLVSRTHCTVKGDAQQGAYCVTDHSKNGTYINGERIPRNVEVCVPRGSILYIGDRQNTFKLN